MTGGAIDPTLHTTQEDVYTFQYSVDPSLTDPAVMDCSPHSLSSLELWLDANDSSFGVDGVGVWHKSGNGRDATVSMGTPGLTLLVGRGVLPAIEIRRNGGMMPSMVE